MIKLWWIEAAGQEIVYDLLLEYTLLSVTLPSSKQLCDPFSNEKN